MTNFNDDNRIKIYDIQFKNVDYTITMFIESQQNVDKLCLEVEEKLTLEKWKGSFESTYIEDLTRKTGNFKQFLIFVNMLETSLSKTSDSVSLELFTYNDLEQLRNKKMNNNSSITSLNNNNSNNNNNKRYLILTYNVEFDRINYPLQLNYQGKPDSNVLLDTIRKLKNEIKLNKSQSNNDSKRNNNEIMIIKLQKENETLKMELDECNNKLKECMLNTNETMIKEIRSLKQMIKNIEEDSLKEKTTFQKQLHKKIKENNQLIEELSEIRSSERTLKHQINSLQTELAVYRRNRVFNNDSTLRSKNNSRESSREASLTRSHKSRTTTVLSRETSLNRQKSDRLGSTGSTRRSSLRERSLSREREITLLAQVASGLKSNRSRSNSYDRSQRSNNRTKTPSPSNSIHSNGSSRGGGRKRFNPTEYIKDKNKKLEEIELKKKRNINRNMNENKLLFNSKNRTPSVSSINSGIDSDNEDSIMNSYEMHSTRRDYKTRNSSKNRKNKDNFDSQLKISTPNNTLNSKSIYKNKKQIDFDTTATNNEEDDDYSGGSSDKYNFYNREKEIKEIDSRLKSLQLFMKNNMP